MQSIVAMIHYLAITTNNIPRRGKGEKKFIQEKRGHSNGKPEYSNSDRDSTSESRDAIILLPRVHTPRFLNRLKSFLKILLRSFEKKKRARCYIILHRIARSWHGAGEIP